MQTFEIHVAERNAEGETCKLWKTRTSIVPRVGEHIVSKENLCLVDRVIHDYDSLRLEIFVTRIASGYSQQPKFPGGNR